MKNTRRFIAIVLIACSMLSILATTASAACVTKVNNLDFDVNKGTLYVTKKDNAPLRKKASNSGSIIERLPANTYLSVTDTFWTIKAAKWHEVTYKVDGKLKTAYIYSENVKKAPASSISIGSGSYNPSQLKIGQSYGLSGKITSALPLTKVVVGVYDATGNTTDQVQTRYPNTTTFDIRDVDPYIIFNALKGSPEGVTYYLRVAAFDVDGAAKVLVNNEFTVKGFAWPLPGYTYISSGFGYRIHPIYGYGEGHGGVDVPAPEGTNILAAADGVATSAWHSSYGNYVFVDHPDGSRTIYAHMSSHAFSGSRTVKAGDVIGYIGSTGDSTGNHLHFEIRAHSHDASARVNPLDLVQPR